MTERDITAAKLKLGLLVLMAALCWLLTGCVRDEVAAAEAAAARLTPDVYTDSATGCEYVSANGSGITPRIAADGKTQLGCKGSAPGARP